MIPGLEVACAICGARDTRRLYTKFDWGIERCRRCGLVYANPRAPEEAILARYSPEYFWNDYMPAVSARDGRFDDRHQDATHRPMLDLIRRHAPGARRLLEVGCGAGLFLRAASRAGWDVSGLELSTEGAAFARDRLGLDVRTERAESMTFPAASFDVAVMFDVIEHLFEPRQVLEATARALRPGGLLVISTPNFDALSRVVLGRDWAVLNPLEHVYYFTERTLAALVEASGFRDVRFERRFEGWGPGQTMNHEYTHAPEGLRARTYGAAVLHSWTFTCPIVQRAGWGDALLCLASQPGAAHP